MILIKDRLSTADDASLILPVKEPTTFKTHIMIGTNPYVDARTGITYLGEVLDEGTNQTVLGGSLYTLEKLFNVKASYDTGYLNDKMGIATGGPEVTTHYSKDHCVCLFGVGAGGAGDSSFTTYDVRYQQDNLDSIIPFRFTSDELNEIDSTKYWFRKKVETEEGTKTAYYLKRFESTPKTHTLWDDAEGDDDGTEIDANVSEYTGSMKMKTFIEIILKIDKKDLVEFYEYNGNIQQARFNTIGLFAGIPAQVSDGTMDYKQVMLFSAYNINNEMLNNAKDLTVLYRIYTH